MAITANFRNIHGLNTGGGGRGPYPLVNSAGTETTSTHTFSGDATRTGRGVRFRRPKKSTGVQYNPANKRLTLSGFARFFSWEKQAMGVDRDGEWTQSPADSNLWYHDGSGLHGKPIAFRANGVALQEAATLLAGVLTAGQWAFGDIDSIGSNRIYYYSPNTGQALECIYGDGTHLQIESATEGGGAQWYEVKDKPSIDSIDLEVDFYPTGIINDVIVYMAVRPWTDLRYRWSITGGTGTPLIHVDKRKGANNRAIPYETGKGPQWPCVFPEGWTTSTLTLLVDDPVNGDAQASRQAVYTETSWSGGLIRYVASTGDNSDGLTLATAWTDPHTGMEWLRTAAAPAELVFLAGDTLTKSVVGTTWNNVAGDRRIRTTVSGTKCEINWTFDGPFVNNSGNSHGGLRVMDIYFNRNTGSLSGTPSPFTYSLVGAGTLLLRCKVRCNIPARGCIAWGTGNTAVPDSLIYDCDSDSAKTGGGDSEMTIYADYHASSVRRAVYGTYTVMTGAALTMNRLYAVNVSFAYCEMIAIGSAAGPILRWNGDFPTMGVSRYIYSHANYFECQSTVTTAMTVMTLASNGTGEQFQDVLYEQDCMVNRATGTAHQTHGLFTGMDIVIRNCVLLGFNRHVESSSSTCDAKVVNNSAYSARAASCQWIKDSASNGAFVNLACINNATQFPNSTSGGAWLENNQAPGALATTHIAGNVVSIAVVSNLLRWVSSTGNFTDWPTLTNKSGQTNTGGAGGSAVNPGFTDEANDDLTLEAGSPCIGTGFENADIYDDYLGNERSGAIDVGAYAYIAGLTTIQKLMLDEETRKRNAR